MATAIEFENISKQYRLGLVSTGTLSHDLNRFWQTKILRREDPYLKVGETNDRASKGNSDYVWALKDINFKIEQGDVVGIIGRNGAGKSTLLKLLSRVTAPTTGIIRAKGRIASLLEVGTGFHPEMTGRENIYMNGAIMGMTRSEITRKLDEIVDFSGCERYLDTPVKRYSSGMTVRLGFAIAAHLEPEILVVDEVLAVGDAEFQKKAIGKMQNVSKGEGRTVLFVSHNMDSMMNLCKKGILLKQGRIKFEGSIKSTVEEYIGEGKNYSFLQRKSNFPIFIQSVYFTGSASNSNGTFSYSDFIEFDVILKKQASFIVSKKTVASIVLMTINRTRICNNEIPIFFSGDELKISLKYKPETLLPGKYLIRVVVHIPNEAFFDRQDTCTFSIIDNGTEYLKYKGTDNGLISFKPEIQIQ